jgi:beta-galactosidase
MLKEGTISRIESYVKNGGNFVATYLSGIVDKDDLCFLGGFPGNELKDVFGIWVEETDSLPDGMKNIVEYNGKEYEAINFCDILHSKGADVLATYKQDFYSETPAVTENNYGKGKAYYTAFANNGDFFEDFSISLINEHNIKPDTDIKAEDGISIRKRGNTIFVMNFADTEKELVLDKEYKNVINGNTISGKVPLSVCGYLVLE